MNRSDLPIAAPCGVSFQDMTPRDVATRLCAACNKHVHDLSRMTRPEAQRILASQATEGLCVRYLYDERGEILFAPEAPKLVPASRLTVLKRLVAAAAVAAAPLSLAACMMGTVEPPPPRPPEPCPVMVQGGLPPSRPVPSATPSAAPSTSPAPSASSAPIALPR